jgi:hypothetical protein
MMGVETMKTSPYRLLTILSCSLLATFTVTPPCAGEPQKIGKAISSVLREPLPAEELTLSEDAADFIIAGPTFTYRVQKATGAISAIHVVRNGRTVIQSDGPAAIRIDGYRAPAGSNDVKTAVVSSGKDKIVIEARSVLRHPSRQGPEVESIVVHTFFNDGVVVSEVKLTPRSDLPVESAVAYQLPVQGQFSHWVHKRRDEGGETAVRGSLPDTGAAVRQNTLTSCLQVFSPTAALAIFTDGGAIHRSQKNVDTAVVDVRGRKADLAQVTLTQYLVHVAPGDKPYVLKAGEGFRFRVGISVAPNRLPHPRMHDLRMFTWIGDAKFPYPTDEEIAGVAQLGFTLYQMHRLGTPGEPRPPAGELDRVVRKVHDSGMLFLWEENADLLFADAPGVRKLKAEGKWSLWQGFNYGGRYTATMDPYCNLVATCLASPNGLADYRLANIERMLRSIAVDGIYLDDNLPYCNCTLWKEHGHPRKVYDCLIELHDMNWRRRELMRRMCPHTVLVSHSSRAYFLPTVCDFDAQIYGEGYSFASLPEYWRQMTALPLCLSAQPMIWPGDSESQRCAASVAYNYDLLTGGGQYTQIDWRVFARKFPYANGVSDREAVYVKTYNLAQYYFGLYESRPYYFADSADLFTTISPLSYATIYHNQVFGDWLVPIANMDAKPISTSLVIRAPQRLGIAAEKTYAIFDVHHRTVRCLKGAEIDQGFREIALSGRSLALYYLRPAPSDRPYHLWGGKRIAETWDQRAGRLTVTVQGPAGGQDEVFIGGAKHGISQVMVGGRPASFFYDSTQGIAHGQVTFTNEPLKIEVLYSPNSVNQLPEKPVAAGPLAQRARS